MLRLNGTGGRKVLLALLTQAVNALSAQH
jgi:hypothetical protein